MKRSQWTQAWPTSAHPDLHWLVRLSMLDSSNQTQYSAGMSAYTACQVARSSLSLSEASDEIFLWVRARWCRVRDTVASETSTLRYWRSWSWISSKKWDLLEWGMRCSQYPQYPDSMDKSELEPKGCWWHHIRIQNARHCEQYAHSNQQVLLSQWCSFPFLSSRQPSTHAFAWVDEVLWVPYVSKGCMQWQILKRGEYSLSTWGPISQTSNGSRWTLCHIPHQTNKGLAISWNLMQQLFMQMTVTNLTSKY